MTEIQIGQALQIIARMLEKNGFNAVQELVLRECWLGKTYREIAADSGYDADYIRVVGSYLWQDISSVLAEKISKHNFKFVLIRKAKEGKLAAKIPASRVPLNSIFYIERPPVETIARKAMFDPGGLIAIESPVNMGKTSLMIRLLAQARSQNYRVVSLNFQLAESSVLSDLAKFLRWLMANITLQLGMESAIDRYWQRDLGAKVSCTNYLQQHILERLSEPLVLALDEVDRLFNYPEIIQEFMPLIEFWHEEANHSSVWQKLRTIAIYSTRANMPKNFALVPFDFGLKITLPEFNFAQVKELANRYQFRLEVKNLCHSLTALMEMVGGHPYLIALAFHALSIREISFEQLLAEAPTPFGIYRTYLTAYFAAILDVPELFSVFAKVVAGDPVPISGMSVYKLESIGSIKFLGNKVVPSCKLYCLYFRNYLAI